MKLMARSVKHYKFNDGSEHTFVQHDWDEVKECRKWWPSGLRKCVRFMDGSVYKLEEVELCYVF